MCGFFWASTVYDNELLINIFICLVFSFNECTLLYNLKKTIFEPLDGQALTLHQLCCDLVYLILLFAKCSEKKKKAKSFVPLFKGNAC